MAKEEVITFEPDVITAAPPQKTPSEQPAKKPLDVLDTAEKALKKNMGGLLGHALSGDNQGFHHPTAFQARTASVLHAQQTHGNYYVQRAIEQYQQKSKGPVVKPGSDGKEKKSATSSTTVGAGGGSSGMAGTSAAAKTGQASGSQTGVTTQGKAGGGQA